MAYVSICSQNVGRFDFHSIITEILLCCLYGSVKISHHNVMLMLVLFCVLNLSQVFISPICLKDDPRINIKSPFIHIPTESDQKQSCTSNTPESCTDDVLRSNCSSSSSNCSIFFP